MGLLDIILCALLAFNIAIAYRAIQAYGDAKYMEGKLDGFNEASKIGLDVVKKLRDNLESSNKSKDN